MYRFLVRHSDLFGYLIIEAYFRDLESALKFISARVDAEFSYGDSIVLEGIR